MLFQAIETMDFNGDGVDNLVVVTSLGVQVLLLDAAPSHARLVETLEVLEEVR